MPATLAGDEYPRLTRAIALLTALLVAAVGVACAGADSDDGSEGRIAFAIELDGDWRLATANANASGDLTVHPGELPWDASGDLTGFLRDAKWSPDGKRIATFGFSGDWVINVDGTGLRRVAADPDASFAWSPDGSQIAFQEHGALYIEDSDGTNRRLMVLCNCPPYAPLAWSRDGRTIAYAEWVSDTGIGASTQIKLVHPDGTGKRALTRGGMGPAPELSWSPDSNQVAFTRPPVPYVVGSDGIERDNPEKPAMYVISTDGSGERRLGPGDRPVWSPKGTRIAFVRGRVVYTTNSDGRGERRLGPGDHLSWSPSGTQIALSRDHGERSSTAPNTAIWVLNADGSGSRQIWPRQGLCKCGAPTWLPDS